MQLYAWQCSSTGTLTRPLLVPSGNHAAILKQVGYKDVRQYAYYKEETRGLDIEGMIRDLEVSRYHWVGRACFKIHWCVVPRPVLMVL